MLHTAGECPACSPKGLFTAETGHIAAAEKLAAAEKDLVQEFLRWIALGDHHWVAQKKAELVYGWTVTIARAELDITRSHLGGI
jgi:hypothetical protein